MIEVEKKFKLSEDQSIRLLEGAEFLGEKIFTDSYYDTNEFSLTKNDIWLRDRSGDWELKIPRHQIGNNSTQQYQEIEGEEKIREVFSIVPKNDFLSDIQEFGYEIFCDCKTTRKKYKKDGFNIDIDFVDYGDFSYSLAEIELMVEGENQMNEAAEKIEKFAHKNGLQNSYVRGKVLEYLIKKKPEHFKALVDCGVVRE
jgi:adenylate cyclase class IV